MENITDLHKEYSEEYPLIQGFREVEYIDWLEFRLMESKQINLSLGNVSNLPDDNTIEFLYDNGAHSPFYGDILEEVGLSSYHFINGMKAMRNILIAANKGD